jgi:hypothetical protein
MELLYIVGLITSAGVILAILIRWWISSNLYEKPSTPVVQNEAQQNIFSKESLIYKVERQIKIPKLSVKLDKPKVNRSPGKKSFSFKAQKPRVTKKG